MGDVLYEYNERKGRECKGKQAGASRSGDGLLLFVLFTFLTICTLDDLHDGGICVTFLLSWKEREKLEGLCPFF
jgi:hypothetical protein